jgi:hypothetical protein
LTTVPIVFPDRGGTVPNAFKGDQAVFWANGYQALLLTDTGSSRYPDYHASGDSPDKLNYAFIADVCRGVVAYAASLSNKA